MSEELEEDLSYKQGITHSTVCEHEFGISPDQDPHSNMTSVICSKCWAAASLDPMQTHLISGKIVTKEA